MPYDLKNNNRWDPDAEQKVPEEEKKIGRRRHAQIEQECAGKKDNYPKKGNRGDGFSN